MTAQQIMPVQFDRVKLARLMAEYNKAVGRGDLQFKLDGLDYLVAYAKHLIEYLDGRLDHD